MSSILKKLNKKSLIVLTGLCLILLFTIFNITKKDKLKEIKTVELLSGNRNYEEQEEGAWNLEKSAKWTGFHKAQIEFNFDSIAKTSGNYEDVLLVIDVSGSMEGNKLDKVKSDAKELSESLLSNPNNKVGIITFESSSNIELDLTNDLDTVLDKIDSLSTLGCTNYYQALVNVNSILENYTKESNRDFVVLFLTDGYPNEENPNEVGEYTILKDNYPYIDIAGIQYEMGDDILDPIVQISDRQYIADMDTLNNVLFEAASNAELFENVEVIDYINEDFKINSEEDIHPSIGTAKLENDNGKQKVIWTIPSDNLRTGVRAKLTIDVELQEDSYDKEYVITNEKEEIKVKIPDEPEEQQSTTIKPTLKNKYEVVYDGNSPSDCNVSNVPSKKTYSPYEPVTIEDNAICNGYNFKKWNIITQDVSKPNNKTFIMPDSDVNLIAKWGKINVSKAMNGEVYRGGVLYNVVKNDAEVGTNAAEYTGEVTDTYDEQGNEKIYYYKGENPNNNVIFANYCWKMVRTTTTGGVKMIYNGIPTNGTCNNTGTNSQIGTSKFNPNFNSPAYVGYMYNTVYTYTDGAATSGSLYGTNVSFANGTYTLTNTSTKKDANHHYSCNNITGSCTTVRYYYYDNYYIELSGGKNIQTALDEMLNSDNVNNTNSTIKTTIDNWYASNMTNYTDYLEDTVFCNDRSMSNYESSGWNPNGGSLVTGVLNFGAYSRNIANLKCTNVTDRFSISNNKAKLTYPVGLLSMDEALLARTTSKYSSDNYYLKSGKYWIGSPYYFIYFSADGSSVDSSGRIVNYDVSRTNGARPVVSLKTGTIYSEGDGSVNSPYVIDLDETRRLRNKKIIYFEKPNEWATPYAYLTGDIENSWPGIKLNQVKGNLYSFKITNSMIPDGKNDNNLNFEIQFNNGGSTTNSNSQYKYKLSKVNFDGFNKVYKITSGSTSTNEQSTGVWETYQDKNILGRIYLNVPDAWEYPHAYVYRPSDEYKPLGDWPGVELTNYKDNKYYFEITSDMIDDDITNYTVSFNNGGTNYNQSDASKKYKLSDVNLIGYDKVYNPLTNYNSVSGNSTGEWLDLD